MVLLVVVEGSLAKQITPVFERASVSEDGYGPVAVPVPVSTPAPSIATVAASSAYSVAAPAKTAAIQTVV